MTRPATSCGAHDRLPQLARHPQPRGRRRRALPGEDGRGAGRARLPRSRSSARRTPAAPPEEVVDGVRFVRRGSKLSVYPAGMRALRRGDLGRRRRRGRRAERAAVLLPAGHPHGRSWCWSTTCTASSGRWSTRAWSAGSAGGSSAGWRPLPLPAVPVRRGLARHPRRAGGARRDAGTAVAVVHNGTDPVVPVAAGQGADPDDRRRRPAGPPQAGRARHRRRRSCLRERAARICACTSSAAGGGRARLHAYAVEHGAGDDRRVRGPRRRGRASRRSTSAPGCWLCPRSRRGGDWWSARPACTRTPTVAYRSAGGTRESIADGRSGVLVDTPEELHAGRSASCSPTSAAAATWEKEPASPAIPSHGSTPSTRSRSCCGRCWPVGASRARTLTFRRKSRTADQGQRVSFRCRSRW